MSLRFSRIRGAELHIPDPPLRAPTIPALLERAEAVAAGEAIVMPGERLTYAELGAMVEDFAGRLHAARVARGERVGLLQDDSANAVAQLLAVMSIGAVPVPVNTRYKSRELEFLAADAGLRVLVAAPTRRALLHQVELPPGCELLGDGDAPRHPASTDRPGQPTGGDDGLILYTSGTTASPKGCVYSHAGMVAQGFAYAQALGLTPEDRYFTPLPFFHVSAIVSLLAVLSAGCALCHVGSRFDPEPSLEMLASERCTVAFPAFETIWLQVLNLPQLAHTDLSALRLIVNVGSPGSLRRMQEAIPTVPQVSAFGGTEYGGFATLGDVEDSLEARVTTSGRPLAGVELRAIDPASDRDVPIGETGEALMRGPSRFARYHGDDEATAAAVDADGWYHTGDLIRIDARRRVSFVGRSKDMLKVGGENVAAAEVESFLMTHPAVDIVQVVAAPDARYVEVPAAFVQLRPGATCSEDELINHCIGQIATFKVPRYVRFVEDWPMSGTKIQKFRLRERIAGELAEAGISEAPKIRTRPAEAPA